MKYRVSLSDFTVEADSADQAQLEAAQTVLESPDLFIVSSDDEDDGLTPIRISA